MPSVNRSQKKELKSSKVKDQENSRKQLVASVESFASYLRHLVRPQDGDSELPPVKWSDEGPSISSARTPLRKASEDGHLSGEKSSEEHRLSREKALLKVISCLL